MSLPTSTSRFNGPREGIAQLFDGDPRTKGLTFGEMVLEWPDGTQVELLPAAYDDLMQMSGIELTPAGLKLTTAPDTARFPARNPAEVTYTAPDGTFYAWPGALIDLAPGAVTLLPFAPAAVADPAPAVRAAAVGPASPPPALTLTPGIPTRLELPGYGLIELTWIAPAPVTAHA